jgi:hypothetical protein
VVCSNYFDDYDSTSFKNSVRVNGRISEKQHSSIRQIRVEGYGRRRQRVDRGEQFEEIVDSRDISCTSAVQLKFFNENTVG